MKPYFNSPIVIGQKKSPNNTTLSQVQNGEWQVAKMMKRGPPKYFVKNFRPKITHTSLTLKLKSPGSGGKVVVALVAILDIYSSFHTVFWMSYCLGQIHSLNLLFPISLLGKTIFNYASYPMCCNLSHASWNLPFARSACLFS